MVEGAYAESLGSRLTPVGFRLIWLIGGFAIVENVFQFYFHQPSVVLQNDDDIAREESDCQANISQLAGIGCHRDVRRVDVLFKPASSFVAVISHAGIKKFATFQQLGTCLRPIILLEETMTLFAVSLPRAIGIAASAEFLRALTCLNLICIHKKCSLKLFCFEKLGDLIFQLLSAGNLVQHPGEVVRVTLEDLIQGPVLIFSESHVDGRIG